MAWVTIHSDFGAQENEICQFPLFPDLFAMKWWDLMPWSLVFECRVFSQRFQSSFTFTKRLFSSSSLSATRVVSCAYLRLLILMLLDLHTGFQRQVRYPISSWGNDETSFSFSLIIGKNQIFAGSSFSACPLNINLSQSFLLVPLLFSFAPFLRAPCISLLTLMLVIVDNFCSSSMQIKLVLLLSWFDHRQYSV